MNGIQSLPRGAGRAKYFRPDLLDKSTNKPSIVEQKERSKSPIASTSAHNGSEISTDSNSSRASQIERMKETKSGAKGIHI